MPTRLQRLLAESRCDSLVWKLGWLHIGTNEASFFGHGNSSVWISGGLDSSIPGEAKMATRNMVWNHHYSRQTHILANWSNCLQVSIPTIPLQILPHSRSVEQGLQRPQPSLEALRTTFFQSKLGDKQQTLRSNESKISMDHLQLLRISRIESFQIISTYIWQLDIHCQFVDLEGSCCKETLSWSKGSRADLPSEQLYYSSARPSTPTISHRCVRVRWHPKVRVKKVAMVQPNWSNMTYYEDL